MSKGDIEDFIAEQPLYYELDMYDMADIMMYKSKYINAEIPAWVYREIADKLHEYAE